MVPPPRIAWTKVTQRFERGRCYDRARTHIPSLHDVPTIRFDSRRFNGGTSTHLNRCAPNRLGSSCVFVTLVQSKERGWSPSLSHEVIEALNSLTVCFVRKQSSFKSGSVCNAWLTRICT